jgi:Fe-S cluster assembly protein SufD
MADTVSTDVLDSSELLVIENFKNLKDEGKLNAALSFLNDAALERFESMGYPHRTHEMFTFVNRKELTATQFDCRYGPEREPDADTVRRYTTEGCDSSVIVIVDGKYNEELSNVDALKGAVELTRLEDAACSGWVRERLAESLELEKDAFALINSAFTAGVVVVDIADGARLETPLQILNLSTPSSGKSVMTVPRVMIRAGSAARAGMVVKYVGNQDGFVNSFTDILVEKEAEVNYSQVQLEPGEGYHFSKSRVTVKGNGKFFAVNGIGGGRLVRSSYEVALLEEGAELGLSSVSVLRGAEQAHHFVLVRHEAPRCLSNQWFRNIVNDRARTSVNSTVKVLPGAQETVSTQLINNLMLSPDARADNKPNLMIYADDVKCTHGATVAQLDDEQLFYLRSRGMPEAGARSLLTTSFARSIIDKVNYPPVAREMADTLLGKLEDAANG